MLSTFTHGLRPRISVTTGFSLARGMRASSTSMTTSCAGIASSMRRRALFIWPGNHWMLTHPFLALRHAPHAMDAYCCSKWFAIWVCRSNIDRSAIIFCDQYMLTFE